MQKIYKIAMFVLLGFGALLVVGGISLFGEDTAAAIFGIVFGLIVALPMVVLYKPLSDKRKAAALAKLDENGRERVSIRVENVKKTAMRDHYGKREKAENLTYNRVSITPYKNSGKTIYAVTMDGDKVGDIERKASEISKRLEYLEITDITPYFDKGISDAGKEVYNCTLRITFEAKK